MIIEENVHSNFRTQGVVQCPRQCAGGRGVLVLDPQSAPKWRISCNKCPAVVTIFEGAVRVKVLDKQCKSCGAQLFSAEYKVGYLQACLAGS